MVIIDAIIWAVINSCVVAAIIGIIAVIYTVFKNDATANAREVIIEAIFLYQKDRLENQCMCGTPVVDEVDYSDMEPYEKTLNRFYDWGYTRILPKDKFEIIKPLIEKE
jgi:hypothetical protein